MSILSSFLICDKIDLKWGVIWLVSNIIKLDIDYENFMNEGFPYFILDIYICSLSDEEIKSGLSYYRYGFPSIWNNPDLYGITQT